MNAWMKRWTTEYSALKKKNPAMCNNTWMGFEDIMQSDISEAEKDK